MKKSRARAAAERLFRKDDDAGPLTEHEQDRLEASKKTERLRALRLVKEAEEREARQSGKATTGGSRRQAG